MKKYNVTYVLNDRKLRKSENLNEKSYKESIEKAVEIYNDRSKNSCNLKKIDCIEIIKSYDKNINSEIHITLESEAELVYPGRALYLFSKVLVGDDDFNCLVKNKRLFMSIHTNKIIT